jgi:hypothetical protein
LKELGGGAAPATIGKAGPDTARAPLNGYPDFVRNNPAIYVATLARR